MRRLRVAAAAVAVAAVLVTPNALRTPSAQAQTTPPPSLQGEQFYAVEAAGQTQGRLDISGACTAAVGTRFTLTYRAEGIASGPYPGAYVETGTITAEPVAQRIPGVVTGVVVTWTASFTIDSRVGDVTGRKTLSQEASLAECYDLRAGFEIKGADALLQYEATIRTPTGQTYADAGKADAIVQSFAACPLASCLPAAEVFQENFVLSTGLLPLDTAGKATGGGQILSATGPLDRVTFGFNVRQNPNGGGLSGNCNVLDHATRTKVKCLTVTDYVQGANTATWSGTAEVNGAVETYRITVQDNGEPNRGVDTFWLSTETYHAVGPVQRGNVQLHKQTVGAP